jgi:hypothetical protein
MNDIYKLEFETVNPLGRGRRYYGCDKPICPPEEVPDEFWSEVSRETDNPWQQYNTLKEWASNGQHLVRKVRLSKMISAPEWELVDPLNAEASHARTTPEPESTP